MLHHHPAELIIRLQVDRVLTELGARPANLVHDDSPVLGIEILGPTLPSDVLDKACSRIRCAFGRETLRLECLGKAPRAEEPWLLTRKSNKEDGPLGHDLIHVERLVNR